VENLQKADESLSKDGIKKKSVHMDIKQVSTMEMIKEQKSCKRQTCTFNCVAISQK